MKHHPGCEHIVWANRPGINGYGDCLNRLSYLYRIHENDNVICRFIDKKTNFDKVHLIRKHIFKRDESFLIYQGNEFDREYINGFSFLNPKHDYWPAKIIHDTVQSKKIAFHFYQNNFSKKYQSMLSYLEFDCKIYQENLNNLRNDLYWAGYELVSLYDVNDSHGFKVMKNPIDCIRANMYILQECDWYVGSEGFMSHLARAMRVPGLFYRNDKNSAHYNAIRNTLEQPIHHMVSSSEEIKKTLDICT